MEEEGPAFIEGALEWVKGMLKAGRLWLPPAKWLGEELGRTGNVETDGVFAEGKPEEEGHARVANMDPAVDCGPEELTVCAALEEGRAKGTPGLKTGCCPKERALISGNVGADKVLEKGGSVKAVAANR